MRFQFPAGETSLDALSMEITLWKVSCFISQKMKMASLIGDYDAKFNGKALEGVKNNGTSNTAQYVVIWNAHIQRQ